MNKECFLEEYMAKSVDVVVVTEHTVGSMSSKKRKSGLKPIKVCEIRRQSQDLPKSWSGRQGSGEVSLCVASVLACTLVCDVRCS